ncbi:nitronate monooxygenase, partial [Ruixingdingia sedimenti]
MRQHRRGGASRTTKARFANGNWIARGRAGLMPPSGSSCACGRIPVISIAKDCPMSRRTLRTPLCDLLGIEVPILQAGMGGVAFGPLAAAVSAAGGLGTIAAISPTPA